MRSRESMAMALLGCLLGLACVPDPPTPPRLRQRDLSSGGVAVQGAGLFDTRWNVPCYFVQTTEGEWRCLPDVAPPPVEFLDVACKIPVAITPPGPDDRPFKLWVPDDSSPGGCSPPARYAAYRRSEPPRLAQTFRHEQLGCPPNPEGPITVFPLERVTEQAVSGMRTHGPVRGGLGHILMFAEGRLASKVGWYAEDFGVECDFRMFDPVEAWARTNRPLRCLPRDADLFRSERIFADVSCSQPVLLRGDNACTPARFGLEVSADRCPTSVRVLRLGNPVPAPYEKTFAGDRCEPQHEWDGRAYPVDQEEIPIEMFPRGQPKISGRPTRIRAQYLETALGDDLGTGHLWDEELKRFCGPVRTVEGRVRCIPDHDQAPDGAFADAACTQPVMRFLGERERCEVNLFGQYQGDLVRLVRLGKKHEGPLYFVRDGTCAAIGGALSREAYLLEDDLPLERFADLQTNAP